MINYSGQLNKKDTKIVWSILQEIVDLYGDFYITRNNLRLFIKDNLDLFFQCLKQGDKLIWDEQIGFLFITGFSDKAKRIYIKPLINDMSSADKLIKILIWNLGTINLYIKIKKNNPIKQVFLNNNFSFKGDRGKEILLCRKKFTEKLNSEDKGELKK